MKNTPENFAKIGEALHGPSWRAALAVDLGVAERTVRRWEHGEAAMPSGIWSDLAKLCRKHSAALMKLAEQLDGIKAVSVYAFAEWDPILTHYRRDARMTTRERIEARRGWKIVEGSARQVAESDLRDGYYHPDGGPDDTDR